MKAQRYIIPVLFFLFCGIGSISAKQGVQYVSSENILPGQVIEQTVDLENKLNQLEQEYNISFLYRSSLVQGKRSPAKQDAAETLHEKLTMLLKPHGLVSSYLDKRTFVISLAPKKELEISIADTVTGTVMAGNTSETLPGVNILIKGTTKGTASDMDGNYRLTSVGDQD